MSVQAQQGGTSGTSQDSSRGASQGASVAERVAASQDTSSQDTSVANGLRPNSFGAYIVGCFPSPASGAQAVTIQTYNRNPVELSVTLYDDAGRELIDLAPRQTMPGGLQTFTIPPNRLSSGVYHVQLLTYVSSDPSAVVDLVDEARFIISR